VISGKPHQRAFDLRSCLSATAVRRNPHVKYASDRDGLAAATSLSKEQLDGLHIFELVWKGRTHRFACLSIPARAKWLGYIFSVLSKYSHTASASDASPVHDKGDVDTIGSATIRSLDLPSPQDDQTSLFFEPPVLTPRRDLSKVQQESLYASVSEMLSGTQNPSTESITSETKDVFSSRAASRLDDLPDVPRYALVDVPPRSVEGKSLPIPARGAWSDYERISTKSDTMMDMQPPSRAVARDLQRLLTTLERDKSSRISQSDRFPEHVANMQAQLANISSRLKAGSFRSKHSHEDRNMADKIDELLQ
jgi:hypothetical protein